MGIEVSKYANLGKSLEGGKSPLTGINSAILRLSKDISDELKEYFERNNINATSALSNSIGGLPVKIGQDGVEIQISAEDYFKFIDEGVNGLEQNQSSPYSFKTLGVPDSMVNGIKSSWIGARGLPLFPQFRSFDEQAYAIAVSVKKKGIKAKNILDGVEKENKLEQRIADSLEAALGYSVELTFNNILRDVDGNN